MGPDPGPLLGEDISRAAEVGGNASDSGGTGVGFGRRLRLSFYGS